MIDQPTIDRILDAAQIVDVVSEFVTLRKRGVNFVGLCPFHDDKTPSFYVSPAKGLCKCFACGKGGNAVHFVMEHEQMTYPEALRWLAKKYNIEIKERELTDEEKQVQNIRESLFVVNEFARDYFQNILYNHADGKAIAMSYFRQRGIRDDIVKKFQLGYSTTASDALAQEAMRKGYKKEFLLKTGLCYEKEDGSLRDRFWGRVIFPWFNISGKVLGFGGRVLDSRTKGVNQKYVNSPESEIFSKRKELYGIYQAKAAIVKADCVYMVEGYTDVIAMHQCGLENVVANSGTALSEQQIRLLHRFTSNITLLYDGDEAGIKASIRGIDMLLAEGMNIKVLLLPDGDDPDSFSRKHNATEFRKYIDDHDKDEQHQRDAEQRLPLQTAGIAHLLGDGGGQEGDAAEGAVRHVGAVACHHHHRHGLTDGTADAQHNACGNAAFGCRNADLEPCFGVGGTQCQTALLILGRHGVEGRHRHRHDAGQYHDGQHHDGRQQAGARCLAKHLRHRRHQHLHAQQAEHHAGDAGQQLDGGDHHGAQLGVGGLGEEYRRQQADGHTDDGSAQRAVDAGGQSPSGRERPAHLLDGG